MSEPIVPSPPNPADANLQIQQDLKGDHNQSIGQIYGGIVVYVSGGEAIINSFPQGSSSEAKTSNLTEIDANPYKGLLAFHEEDSANFFGRSSDIQHLWEQFWHLQNVAIRLLPIYGPSGSGKSSLARAGLIPALGQQPLPGRDRARVAVLVPGTQPLQALATVLARIADNDPIPVKKTREFAAELGLVNKAGQYDGLQRITNVLPEIGTVPLIILVDQFEEVYSLCKDVQERDAFIATLLYAASDDSRYASVILTMRSDFLGETQKHPIMNRLFSSQGFLVPMMDEDCLYEAIAQPAKNARCPLDTATVRLLAEQTAGREGALPLLQFALTRIWEGLKQGVHPAVTLEHVGGVGGALAGEAKHIYESLSDADQLIARRIFLGLVQLGEGTKDTRRRTQLRDLVSQQTSLEQVKQVLTRFSNPSARLITLASKGDLETAEVTHEALFEHWQELKTWLDNGRSDIRFQRRLEEAAKYWDGNSRPDGNLWRPPDLDLLKRYQQRAGDNMTPLQAEFFVASRALEQNWQRKEKQQQQFQQWTIRGLVTLSLFAISLASAALYQLQQTQRQRVEQLTITSDALLDSQPVTAMVNAIAAIRLGQSSFVRFPNYSISRSIHGSLLKAVQLTQEQNLWPQDSKVYSIALGLTGERIISGGGDNTVRIWDAATGKQIGQPLTGHVKPVYSVAFSADGKRIISGSVDKTIRIWDATTGKPISQPLIGHKNGVHSVAFSADGKRIISGSGDKTIRIWDAATGKPISQPLIGHKNGVHSVAFSADGKQIVSGSGDSTIRIWDATTGKPIGQPLIGHTNTVRSVAFSADGKQVASGSVDKTIRIWDAVTGESIGQPLIGHTNTVRSVAFSADGKQIVSGSVDKTIRIWDAVSNTSISQLLIGHTNTVRSVAFSADGKQIVSGSRDSTIRLWNAATGKPIGQSLRGHTNTVYSVAFSPDGKRIVSGSVDSTIRLWDAATGKSIGRPFRGHTGTVYSVAFSANGRQIASSSADSAIRLWDAVTGKLIGQPWKGHIKGAYSVAFSTDGKQIVSGSVDRTIQLWDAATGKPIGQPLRGHRGTVYSVAFSANDKQIISGSGDKTIRIWNATTGKPIGQPLIGHTDIVRSVAFSPDGKQVVSGGRDSMVRLWRVDWVASWENLLQIACKQLQHHSTLINPTTDVTKEAKWACEQYARK
ncbi:PQQ-binding-like beta-propeller repeat protein [Phormidium sp. FACHB-592]|uniref:PQQ-binding-like beta-propeller repeat protein n=1 Tax=Stenomitos frigidus AS-A4 TaxID=2933935 RepID=A0ABV0KRW1_9CYAN|nr:PQQ-binding-like beta-propeller repeat protein [Phormidium sp. FACHB-592]MBD2078310.1 PQQ-binding-like beta-propeller repeat protein [Phormidium sp. FACHB-592]